MLSNFRLKLNPVKSQESLNTILITVFIAVNLFISVLIRSQNLNVIINTNPLGVNFTIPIGVIVCMLLAQLVFKLKLLSKYPVLTIMILAGVFSNFIELFIFNGVADYLTIHNLHINIADLQIITGLALVNYQVWFKDESTLEKTTTSNTGLA